MKSNGLGNLEVEKKDINNQRNRGGIRFYRLDHQ